MSNIIISVFGRRLREERTARGWSQSELGRRSHVDQAYISQIEKGSIKDPGVSKARALENALRLSPYTLLRRRRAS
jgi:transcriptional regulator with XRE-family HTH domain